MWRLFPVTLLAAMAAWPAFTLAQPAGGEPSGQIRTDGVREPSPPRIRDRDEALDRDLELETDVPDRIAYGSREQVEAEMRRALVGWSTRIERFAAAGGRIGSDDAASAAREMAETWRGLEEQWQAVRQTQSEPWETAVDKFNYLYQDLWQAWNEAHGRG